MTQPDTEELETEESDALLCDVCGQPVHPEIAHLSSSISRDAYYHPDCCPECKADPNRYPGGWE